MHHGLVQQIYSVYVCIANYIYWVVCLMVYTACMLLEWRNRTMRVYRLGLSSCPSNGQFGIKTAKLLIHLDALVVALFPFGVVASSSRLAFIVNGVCFACVTSSRSTNVPWLHCIVPRWHGRKFCHDSCIFYPKSFGIHFKWDHFPLSAPHSAAESESTRIAIQNRLFSLLWVHMAHQHLNPII